MRLCSLLLIALLLIGLAQAAPARDDDASCQLKAKKAQECSLCCALGGFNKFDSAKFAAGKGCSCYSDQKELATNERHGPRRP